MAPLLNVLISFLFMAVLFDCFLFIFLTGALLREELQRVTQIDSQIARSPTIEHIKKY